MTAKIFMVALMIAGGGLVAACSTPTEITTRDGHTTMTRDKPEINDDDGFVTYERDGKEVKVNSSEVQRIEEVK